MAFLGLYSQVNRRLHITPLHTDPVLTEHLDKISKASQSQALPRAQPEMRHQDAASSSLPLDSVCRVTRNVHQLLAGKSKRCNKSEPTWFFLHYSFFFFYLVPLFLDSNFSSANWPSAFTGGSSSSTPVTTVPRTPSSPGAPSPSYGPNQDDSNPSPL